MGIEPITFEPCCHDEHSPAQRCGAADRAEKTQRLRIGPVYVFNDNEKRPAICGRLDQSGDHALFAAGSRRGVHRLVEFSGRLRVWDLKQIPQIELIIRS